MAQEAEAVAAAATAEDSGSSSHVVAVYTATQVAGLQQLMMVVEGLRLRLVPWTVVQGRFASQTASGLGDD